MKLGRVLLILAGIAALGVGGAWLARGQIAEAVYRRGLAQALGKDPFADLPDGLHVALCGAGAPLPDPHRAGPCTAVVAGKRLFIVDVGDGSVRNLGLMRMNPARAEALLLTHYHSDHIGGLGEVMLQHWAGGAATAPLPIYGPQGLEPVVAGFMDAYRQDQGYRIAHHGEKIVPPAGFGGAARPFAVTPDGPEVVVLESDGLKITAFPVRHQPVEPAVGYKFTYKGRSVVISGDTAPSPRVEAEAKGADLLVHEALSPRLAALQRDAAKANGAANIAQISQDILTYHTSPEAAADIARRAGVRYLLLNHIVPGLPVAGLEAPFLGDARSRFRGPLRVGRDGDMISLPAGSTEVTLSNRMLRLR